MVRRREILKTAALLAAGGLPYADVVAAGSAGEAETLLGNVVQKYASLKSYQDRGSVSRVIGVSDSDSDTPYRTDFTTAYQSPSLFRFAFSLPNPYPPLSHIVTKCVVGFDGSVAYFAMKGPDKPVDFRTTDSLNLAIARATGISSGSAHTIGQLLLPDISGLSMLDLVGARLLADTTINDIQCYSISAQHPRGGESQFSIEKDSLLLRRVRTTLSAEAGPVVSEEVRDNIRVNQPVDASLFNSGA
jgi:hypothetical protein